MRGAPLRRACSIARRDKFPAKNAAASRNECGGSLVDQEPAKGRIMPIERDGQIIESAQEARQAERGPTVRNVLVASTSLAIVVMLVVWLAFYR
jgi:hypothetical protein